MASLDSTIVRCVEYLKAQSEPITEQLWQECSRIALHAKRESVRLAAIKAMADRFDPRPEHAPRPAPPAVTLRIELRDPTAGAHARALPAHIDISSTSEE